MSEARAPSPRAPPLFHFNRLEYREADSLQPQPLDQDASVHWCVPRPLRAAPRGAR